MKHLLMLLADNAGAAMPDDGLQAAVAAGVMAAEGEQRAFLESMVASRARSSAPRRHRSSSTTTSRDELVFEAVSGEGEQSLVGTRMPSGTGVAGWVLTTRQPLIVNDTTADSRFSREAAERTGFVPESLMCAPLLHGEQALGVINVLDRPLRPGFALEEIDLLGQFAHQAALALLQLQRARRVQRVLAGESDETQAVARLAQALGALEHGLRRRRSRRVAGGAHEDPRRTGRRAATGVTLADLPDAELVRRMRAGDECAWAAFVERYSRYVYAIAIRAYRLREHDAEDVFQEVFARAYSHLGSLRSDEGIKPWIGTADAPSVHRPPQIEQPRGARGRDRGGSRGDDRADRRGLRGAGRARHAESRLPRSRRPLLLPRRVLPSDQRSPRHPERHDRKPHLALPCASARAPGGGRMRMGRKSIARPS